MTRAWIMRGSKFVGPHVGARPSLVSNPWSLHRNRDLAALLRNEPYYAEFLKPREQPWWSEVPAPFWYRAPIEAFAQLDVKAGFGDIPIRWEFFRGVDLFRAGFRNCVDWTGNHRKLEARAAALLDILEADLRRPFVTALERVRQRKPWERDDG